MHFFQGRYGMDKLNQVLLISALGIYAVSLFFRKTVYPYAILNLIYVALMVIMVLRMFSRNLYRRQEELNKFLSFENRIKAWWHDLRSKSKGNVIDIKSYREYKYLNCPQCMQKLRVPRGKGRLLVTCTKCGCKFQTKS